MEAEALRKHIESVDALPTVPQVLKNILKVIEDPRTSLTEIGNFIATDPVLTSRVLKVVNSPIYGFSGRISSISQALLLLGLNVVRGMLFGVSVFDIMEKSVMGLWGHSMGCAVTARIIATKKGVEEPEEVSVAALLHDIGKVLYSLKFPEEYRKVIASAHSGGRFIFEVEEEVFGSIHSAPGAWIAQKWNFPKRLIEIIGYHHKPHLARNMPLETAIVHLADILIRARGFGFAGDDFVPAVNPAAWELLDLSGAELGDILREMEDTLAGSDDFLHLDD